MRALLMGGQACILYGAAELSRDTDIIVVADAENLARLADALRALDASVTAVPPFTAEVLARGHAVHFRCAAAEGTRLDVMARMRNMAPFAECWSRRTTAWLDGAGEIEVLGLADLVACKKTRRNKDWPMVQRLVDVHFARFAGEPTDDRAHFWLRELRAPELLVAATRLAPAVAAAVAAERPAVAAALADHADADARTASIRAALFDEEARERAADEAYWRPLLAEQEEMSARCGGASCRWAGRRRLARPLNAGPRTPSLLVRRRPPPTVHQPGELPCAVSFSRSSAPRSPR